MTAVTQVPNPQLPCGGLSADELLSLPLSHGGHGNPSYPNGFRGECCVVEWVNRLTVCDPELGAKFGAAERFTDDHPSIAPTIRRFLIRLNDGWLWADGSTRRFAPADAQAILKKYGRLALGTRTTDADERTRGFLCADWAFRWALPQWLDAAGLTEHATTLRGLSEINNAANLRAGLNAVHRARNAAWEARDEAWHRYDAARRSGGAAAEAEAAAEAAVAAVVAVAAEAAAVAAVAVAAEAAVVAVAAVAAEAAAVAAVAAVAVVAEAAVVAVAAEAAVVERLHKINSEIQRGALDLLGRIIAIGRRTPEQSAA